MTVQSALGKIKEIVANTDEHRTRSRRESWDAIKAVLADEAKDRAGETKADASSVDEVRQQEGVSAKRGPGRPSKS